MDPKQQPRSHDMLKCLLGVGTNLQLYVYKTLLSENFVIIFFDRYAKTWPGEHCMQCQ